MIYAIIIIVALALAFIILIRRLPKAIELDRPGLARPEPQVLDQNQSAQPQPARPARQWQAPSFKLPSLPKLNLAQIKWSRPTSQSQPAVTPTAPPSQVAKPSAPDFWQEEKPAPKPASTNPDYRQPPTMVNKVEPRPKGRNLFQEAEDAFAIKDYKKAERLYLRLAAEDPKNPKLYGRLGVIYLEQKNYEDARDSLQVALKLEPNNASRSFNLALTYTQLGSKAKAIQALEAALKYDPSNRKYRKMLDEMVGRK